MGGHRRPGSLRSAAGLPVRTKLRESRLYQLAWAALESWNTSDAAPPPRVQPEEFRSLLAQTEVEARQHGADLLLLVWAGPFNIAADAESPEIRTPYQRETLAYGHRLRLGLEQADGLVDFVPVVQELGKKHRPADIFFDHVHATSLANERFAEALAKKLIPWVRWRLAEAKQPTPRRRVGD